MSLYCPKCVGAKAYCVDSRCHEEINAVRRRYVCSYCDYKFSSYEIIPGYVEFSITNSRSILSKLALEFYEAVVEALRKKNSSSPKVVKLNSPDDEPIKPAKKKSNRNHPWRKASEASYQERLARLEERKNAEK